MKKETKYNTVFIVVLLAVSLPGVVMLVRKKLSQPPRESLGALAAPVRTDVIYVNPLPQDPELKEIVPPLTRAWALQQVPAGATAPDRDVQISDRRSFELIGRQQGNPGATLTLLVWDPRLEATREAIGFDIAHGESTEDGRIEGFELIALPPEVLRELKQGGYMTPPAQIARLTVAFDQARPGSVLHLRGRTGDGPFEDRLKLFSEP